MRARVVVVATLLLSGLAGCQLLPVDVDSPSDPVPTDLEGFYGQSLRWNDCGSEIECATAKAPIDWDEPELGAIDLALVRNPAAGEAQGSILLNPGGPGGSGFEYVYYSGSYSVTPAVHEAFDVVGWDPRGVGRSTPVTCYTDPADMDEVLYGTYDSPYGTEGWIGELTEVEADFAAACLQNTGALLGNIDSASNARDMDMLRAVLGDAKLNFLGYSYGTYFGAVYAELFPENVGRLVLDGALDPLLPDHEALAVQMAGFDSGLRAFMGYCLEQSDCPFTGSVDEALGQVRSMLEAVDARALVNHDDRVLDSATMATGIALNLYSRSYWPDLIDLFLDVRSGDPTSAFVAADQYNSRNADGSYSGNAAEVYVAATCVDGSFADDPASTLERVAEIDAAAPILGEFMAYDDFAVLDVACSNWPVPRADLPSSFAAEGADPILVIGTSNDPATPYAWAQALADQLSSGVLVSYTGEGHTIYNQGSSCVDAVVDAYFVAGQVPAADPHC